MSVRERRALFERKDDSLEHANFSSYKNISKRVATTPATVATTPESSTVSPTKRRRPLFSSSSKSSISRRNSRQIHLETQTFDHMAKSPEFVTTPWKEDIVATSTPASAVTVTPALKGYLHPTASWDAKVNSSRGNRTPVYAKIYQQRHDLNRDQLVALIEDMDQECAEKDDQLVALDDKLDNIRIGLAQIDVERQSLTIKARQLESEKKDLQAQLAYCQQEIKRLSKSLGSTSQNTESGEPTTRGVVRHPSDAQRVADRRYEEEMIKRFMERELEEARETQSALEQQMQSLKEENSSLQKKLNASERRRNALQDEKEELERTRLEMKSSYDVKLDQMRLSHVQDTIRLLEEAESDIDDKNNTIELLKQELSDVKANLESEREGLQAEIESKLSESFHQIVISDIEKRHADDILLLENQLKEKDKIVETIKEQLREWKLRVEKQQQEAQCMSSNYEEEIKALRSQLRTKRKIAEEVLYHKREEENVEKNQKASIEELETKLEETTSCFSDERARSEKLQNHLARIEYQSTMSDKEANALRIEVKKLEREIHNLRTVATADGKTIAALRAQANDSQQELKRAVEVATFEKAHFKAIHHAALEGANRLSRDQFARVYRDISGNHNTVPVDCVESRELANSLQEQLLEAARCLRMENREELAEKNELIESLQTQLEEAKKCLTCEDQQSASLQEDCVSSGKNTCDDSYRVSSPTCSEDSESDEIRSFDRVRSRAFPPVIVQTGNKGDSHPLTVSEETDASLDSRRFDRLIVSYSAAREGMKKEYDARILEIQGSCTTLQNKNQQLSRRLDHLTDQRDQLLNDISAAQSLHKSTQECLRSELSAVRDSHGRETNALKNQMEDALEASDEKVHLLCEKHENQLREMKEQLERAENIKDDAIAEREAALSRIQTMQIDHERVIEKLRAELSQSRAELELRGRKLADEIAQLSEMHDKQLLAQTSKHEDTVKKLRLEVDLTKERLAAERESDAKEFQQVLESKNSELQTLHTNLCTMKASMKSQAEELTSRLTKSFRELENNTREKHEVQMEETTIEMSSLKKLLSEKENAIGSLNDKLIQNERHVATLQLNWNQSQTELMNLKATLSEDLRNSESRFTAKVKALEQQHEEELLTLRSQHEDCVTGLEHTVSEQKAVIEDLGQQVKAMEGSVAHSNEARNVAELRVAEMTSSHQQELASLQGQYESQMLDLQRSLATNKEVMRTLQCQMENSHRESSEHLERLKSEYESKLGALSKEHDILNREVESMEAKNGQLLKVLSERNVVMEAMNCEIVSQLEDIMVLRRIVQKMEDDDDSLVLAADETDCPQTNVQDELLVKETELAELSAEIIKLEIELELCKSSQSGMLEEKARQLEQMERENSRLVQVLSTKESELKGYHSNWSNQLNELKDRLCCERNLRDISQADLETTQARLQACEIGGIDELRQENTLLRKRIKDLESLREVPKNKRRFPLPRSSSRGMK